jgi:hypothetical protein
MSPFHHRLEAVAPWAAGLLLALPTLVAFYPPMSDLPYHEAAIGILRHFGDRSMFPPGLYEYNLGEPNQLFHMVGWAASYVMSTRWVVKLLVWATIVAVPVCAARLARHLGASPLAALLVAPVAVGWLFYWGLIANLIGLAALLAVLPGLDRLAERPTGRRAFATVGAVALLYFCHEAMMFLYGAAALGLAVIHPWSARRTPLRLVPFVASVVFAVAQARWQMRFMSPAVRAVPTLWASPLYKLRSIPNILSPASDWTALCAMSSLCAMTLTAMFWLRSRERRRGSAVVGTSTARLERFRSWTVAYRWELFACVCIGMYLAFPMTLNGATLVYYRWFPPGFAILAVSAAPRDLFVRPARVALIALLVLPVATLLLAWPAFADSNRGYASLEPLLSRVEPGSSVAGLDLGPADPSRTYSFGPASGRILATRGGRLLYAFTDSAVSPVVVARRYQWTESLVRVGFDSYSFRPGQDLSRYQYVLVRANDAPLVFLAIRSLAPEAEYIAGVDEWLLFKSRLPTISPLSRDLWLNGPPPENVRDRMNVLLAEAHKPPAQGAPEEPAAGYGASQQVLREP